MRGIELHDKAAEYVAGTVDTFEFATDTLNEAREKHTHVERQFFFSTAFDPLDAQPDDGETFVSLRCDTIFIDNDAGEGVVYDWKFANSEFGISKHYDELEFFVAGLSAKFSNIGQWRIIVHFPEEDYTLPVRNYSWVQTSRLQRHYKERINSILADRVCRATPSKFRCRLCAHRSADAGGSDFCEFTVV